MIHIFLLIFISATEFRIILGGGAPTDETGTERRFTAVTYFPEIGQLYEKLRKEEIETRKQDRTSTAEMKNRVCKDIGLSGYFRLMRKDEHADLAKAYEDVTNLPRNQIERKYTLYKEFLWPGYARRAKKLHLFGREFTHPLLALALGNFHDYNHEEYMTVCLTKHLGRGRPDLNFVTDPYNVNNALNIVKQERGYIGGRFVFQNSFQPGALIALAEEPAIDSFFPKLKMLNAYQEMRTKYSPSADEASDPICGLKKFEKLRICTSTMNSPMFELIVKFVPDYEQFHDFCKKRIFSLYAGGTSFQEYMLPCKVDFINTDKDDSDKPLQDGMYYVSRAHNSHMAFVWDCSESICSIISIMKNISVIVDRCNYPDCIEF